MLVEEHAGDGLVINQPAGHVEPGESIVAACAREALEETAWEFVPEAAVGVYQFSPPESTTTYVRIAFCGRLVTETAAPLDAGIVRTLWMSQAEVAALPASRLRSPMVAACIDDYCAGVRLPLSMICDFDR